MTLIDQEVANYQAAGHSFLICQRGGKYRGVYTQDNKSYVLAPNNDIGAIINAIASVAPSGGATIMIEAGSYDVKTKITTTKPLRIVGESAGDKNLTGTTLVDKVSGDVMFYADGSSTSFANVWFEHIRFEMDSTVASASKDMIKLEKLKPTWGFIDCYFDMKDQVVRRVIHAKYCYGGQALRCTGDSLTGTLMVYHQDSSDSNNWGNISFQDCHFFYARTALMFGGAGLQDNILVQGCSFPGSGSTAFSYVRTTCNGAVAADASTITVADATGLSANDAIVVLGTNPEVVKIASIDGNDLTLAANTLFAHANGAAVYLGRVKLVVGDGVRASKVDSCHFEQGEVGIMVVDGSNTFINNIFGSNLAKAYVVDGGRNLTMTGDYVIMAAADTTYIEVQNNTDSESINVINPHIDQVANKFTNSLAGLQGVFQKSGHKITLAITPASVDASTTVEFGPYFNVPTGKEVNLWEYGIMDTSLATSTNYQILLLNKTDTTTDITVSNSKRTIGFPANTETTAAKDYTWAIRNNDSGGAHTIGCYVVYSVDDTD